MLSGYKTYILGGLAVLGAIAAYLVGDATLAESARVALDALLAMTIRNGITSASK